MRLGSVDFPVMSDQEGAQGAQPVRWYIGMVGPVQDIAGASQQDLETLHVELQECPRSAMIVVDNPEQSLDFPNALSVMKVGNPESLDAGGSTDES